MSSIIPSHQFLNLRVLKFRVRVEKIEEIGRVDSAPLALWKEGSDVTPMFVVDRAS